MPTCVCGEHISERFERVFAPDGGKVASCPECGPRTGMGLRQYRIDGMKPDGVPDVESRAGHF